MTRFIIIGAGAIGGTIAARLIRCGESVQIVARGKNLAALETQGLRFVSPDCDVRVPVSVVGNVHKVVWQAGDIILLCVKGQHTQSILEELKVAAPAGTPVVCCQNGVNNEVQVNKHFPTYACVVLVPSQHLQPGEVVTFAKGVGGVLDVGCYPTGVDSIAAEVARALARAGFSSRPDAEVMRQKYAKLLANLANGVQALCGDSAGLQPIHHRLIKEALSCYCAANISCASKAEVMERRAELNTVSAVAKYAHLGGSSWQSVARDTGDIEVESLNGEIVRLGAKYGIATHANAVVVSLCQQMVVQRLAPGSLDVATLGAKIRECG